MADSDLKPSRNSNNFKPRGGFSKYTNPGGNKPASSSSGGFWPQGSLNKSDTDRQARQHAPSAPVSGGEDTSLQPSDENAYDNPEEARSFAPPTAFDEDNSTQEALKRKEETPEEEDGEEETEQASKEEKESLNNETDNLYNDDDSGKSSGPFRRGKKKAKLSKKSKRRRKIIGVGITSALVTGGVSLFSLLSGPLQFMHLSQLMQRFHFASVENAGDSRTLQLYKYAKNLRAGTVENTRLGIVGRKIANSVDTKLATIGVEKKFAGGLTGQYEGVTIEPKKFADSAKNGEAYKNLNNEEFKTRFKQDYKISLTDGPEGKLVASSDEIGGFFSNHSFNSVLAEESGFSKVGGTVVTRIMGKRDGITWHPIRKLNNKIIGAIDDKLTAWIKEMKTRIKGGVQAEPVLSGTGDTVTNPDGTTSPSTINTDGAAQANATISDAASGVNQADDALNSVVPEAGAAEGGALKGITQSTGGKVAISATAIVGLVCAAKSLSEAADGLKHDLVILPLIRTGMQAISLGNQLMSGQDIDMTQLSFFAKQLNDPVEGSWATARSIQAELGQNPTGPDLPEAASVKKMQEGTMFSNIIDNIPALGITCKVANSTLGKIVTFAVSLATPVTTGITMLLGSTQAAKDAIGSLVRWMAGSPIPSVVFGPVFGNYVNYGSRLAANDAMAAIGGVELTPGQTAEIDRYEAGVNERAMEQKSIASRYFDIYSPDSLASKVIDSHSPSITSNMASLINVVTQPMKMLGSLGMLFTGKAKAASPVPYDYGFQKVGFSLEDLNSNAYQDPYANKDAVVSLLSANNALAKDYIKRAKDCFGVVLGTDGSLTSDLSTSIDILKKGTSDSPSYSSYNCSDESQGWKRVRFYVLDTKIAESNDCFDSGDSTSCAAVGFN